ncbi:hypothetical protein Btru_055027 [Bulinus truncatus]|nr:hypothetical protein Btru_055027 [Bulinus truncatus]
MRNILYSSGHIKSPDDITEAGTMFKTFKICKKNVTFIWGIKYRTSILISKDKKMKSVAAQLISRDAFQALQESGHHKFGDVTAIIWIIDRLCYTFNSKTDIVEGTRLLCT